jgi:hypothetical protein
VTGLTLKRASASRSSGEWSDDDYDVLADGVVGFLYVETSERFSVQHNRCHTRR